MFSFEPMEMPPDILTFLLRGGHLNVDERKAKGLWPNERLRYGDVLDHLATLVGDEEWFPRKMAEHTPGDVVHEGTVVQKVSPCRFICHSRRHSVCDVSVVAAESQKEFSRARDAAEYYLKWELHLPGSLDSWIVE